MKLQTTIKPRRDGTVIVRGANGQPFTFAPDSFGDLVCDVDDPALLERLLNSEDFGPIDPADFQAASTLVAPVGTLLDSALDAVGHTPEGSPPGEGEDEPDDEGDENAAPVEGAAELPSAPVEGAAAQATVRQSRRRT